MNTKKSFNQLTTTELLKLIQQVNTAQTQELKEKLSISIQAITTTVAESRDKICKIENWVKSVDQRLRRNNIVIFGLPIKNQDNLSQETLGELKKLLNFELTVGDISNIYNVDKNKDNSPIILEFISLLKKQILFKQAYKLKNTGFNDFKFYIDSSDIDIITLTETWLNHQIGSETVTLNKYKFLRADRGSRGGGLGVCIKKIINCRMILSNVRDYLEQL
nr:unnamed protein product [Callosobruchus analis]